MCVLIFSTTFVRNVLHSKNLASHDHLCYIGLHVKYPLFLSDFNETWIFLERFSKNTQI